jgi:hypothetical protein
VSRTLNVREGQPLVSRSRRIDLVQSLAKSLLGWGFQLIHMRTYTYMYICYTLNPSPFGARAWESEGTDMKPEHVIGYEICTM